MEIASLKQVVSAEEWQLRVDLAACYRLVDLYGMVNMPVVTDVFGIRVAGKYRDRTGFTTVS